MTNVKIAYDGGCPFCKNYVHHLHLRNTAADLHLINIRDDSKFLEKCRSNNIDLNDGIFVSINNTEYFADEAMTALAMISTPHTVFNRINIWIFKNQKRAKFIYPILKFGRYITLKILRLPPVK